MSDYSENDISVSSDGGDEDYVPPSTVVDDNAKILMARINASLMRRAELDHDQEVTDAALSPPAPRSPAAFEEVASFSLSSPPPGFPPLISQVDASSSSSSSEDHDEGPRPKKRKLSDEEHVKRMASINAKRRAAYQRRRLASGKSYVALPERKKRRDAVKERKERVYSSTPSAESSFMNYHKKKARFAPEAAADAIARRERAIATGEGSSQKDPDMESTYFGKATSAAASVPSLEQNFGMSLLPNLVQQFKLLSLRTKLLNIREVMLQEGATVRRTVRRGATSSAIDLAAEELREGNSYPQRCVLNLLFLNSIQYN